MFNSLFSQTWQKKQYLKLYLLILVVILTLSVTLSLFPQFVQGANLAIKRGRHFVASSRINLTEAGTTTIIGNITRPNFLPRALAIDEVRNRLFIFDQATKNIFIYNATTLEEVGSVVTTLEDCLSMVIDESYGKLYAGYFGPGAIASNNIAVIDTSNGTLLKYLPSTGHNYLVKDEELNVIYVTSLGGAPFDGGVYQIDVATDIKERISGIWGNLYTSMAVNPVTHELFISNWSQNDNNLFIVNPTTLAVTPVPNMAGFGVAINWTENKAYVSYCPAAGLEGVCIYDRDTGVSTPIHTGNDSSYPLAFNPNVNRLYSSSEVNAMTTIFNGKTNEFTNVDMLSSLYAIGVRYSTDHVYFIGYPGTNVMNGASGEIVDEFPSPGSCSVCVSVVLISQTSGRVYVINSSTYGTVTVFQDNGDIILPPLSEHIYLPLAIK